MARIVAALIAGAVFGAGLAVSEMVDPAKVLAFLDFGGIPAGAWDPSLALVMVGALAVTAVGYRIALGRPRPVLAESFAVPGRREVDRPLLLGALLFGAGWGLVGYCPGPAVAALAYGAEKTVGFVLAMLAGMALHRLVALRGG